MFERYDQNLVVFAFCGCFHELLPIVLGFQGDLLVCEVCQETRHFRIFGCIHELLPIVLVFQGDLHV